MQSLVNPPGNPKASFFAGGEPGDDAQAWLDGATTPSVIPACKRGGFCRAGIGCSFQWRYA